MSLEFGYFLDTNQSLAATLMITNTWKLNTPQMSNTSGEEIRDFPYEAGVPVSPTVPGRLQSMICLFGPIYKCCNPHYCQLVQELHHFWVTCTPVVRSRPDPRTNKQSSRYRQSNRIWPWPRWVQGSGLRAVKE
jgi:hypothetical protein